MSDRDEAKRLAYLPPAVSIFRLVEPQSFMRSFSGDGNFSDWNGDDGFLGEEDGAFLDWEGDDGFI